MANNAILASVYNQYLTTYAPQRSNSRYDTHKRSELKNVYNSMVKINRDAPLYKIDTSSESRQYMIGLKEESRALHNDIVSVMGTSEDIELNASVAFSTDESILSAKYVGENKTSADDSTYQIEVKSLASPQVNLGLYLPMNSREITPGQYSFDVSVGGQGYEFQYSISDNETNYDIQNKLSRLINNSGIKLSASVEEDGHGNSALRIESSFVGSNSNDTAGAFSISETNNRKVSGSVAYFGIDYVAREAKDAEFVVNGSELSSASNTFVLDKQFEIQLNNISPAPGITATVGVKPDAEAAVENIKHLVGSYNNFISSMNSYSAQISRNNSLLSEMNGIVRNYQKDMSAMGITMAEGGTLDMDEESLTRYITESKDINSIDSVKKFTSSLLRKSNQISLNPVAYMNKTVVAYKNPGKNYTSPYTSSAYSGYMFNSYC